MDNATRKPKYTAGKILLLLQQHRSELVRFGVQKIGLFGSYRRGTTHPESDMDFLVVLQKSSFDSYMDVKIFLEDLFGCKVDLVLEDSIKPRLRTHILSEVVYAQGY